jgi:hypothetical protein
MVVSVEERVLQVHSDFPNALYNESELLCQSLLILNIVWSIFESQYVYWHFGSWLRSSSGRSVIVNG